MKKSIIYSVLLAMGMGFTTSCSSDFMELDPVGAVSESTLANDEGINSLLAGAYTALMSQSSHNWTMGHVSLSDWVFGDVIGGDANKGSTAADQPDASNLEQWSFDASNSYLSDKWTACYEAVKRANAVLKVAQQMEEAGKNSTQYQAEARFIKGVQMFEAIKVFGAGVPYVTLEDYLANNDPQVTNHDDSGNLIYVWDKVAEDLKFAYENLPEVSSSVGHVNKWAAAGMLAKLYLYWSSPYNGKNGTADHWNDAYTLLKEMIASGCNTAGVKYALVDKYMDNFDDYTISDNNSESVFEVEQAIIGTAYYPATINGSHAPCPQFITGGWGFYQPSYQYTNCFIVDENGLPDFKSLDYGRKPLAYQEGSACVSDLETYVDPRLDVTAGRFEVPYWDWVTPAGADLATYIRDVSNAGLFFNKKYVPMKTEQGKINDCPLASDKNLHVLRYAEVLLMAAECAIHAGDTDAAVKYINQVRKRAQNSCVTNAANPHVMEVVDQNGNKKTLDVKAAANYRIGLYDESKSYTTDAATEMLKREYRLECGMEGNRWFDLARWGNIANDLAAYAKFENQYCDKFHNTYDPNWVTLPIPSAQITASDGRFIQNSTWGSK